MSGTSLVSGQVPLVSQVPQVSQVSPQIWGPVLWKGMEYIVAQYPHQPSDVQKQAALNYFQAHRYLLPCMQCQEHFTQLLQELPLEQAVQSRSELTKWLIEAHNRVNKRLGKPLWSKPSSPQPLRSYGDQHNSSANSDLFDPSGIASHTLCACQTSSSSPYSSSVCSNPFPGVDSGVDNNVVSSVKRNQKSETKSHQTCLLFLVGLFCVTAGIWLFIKRKK